MAEWLIERGIGEDRAVLVENGTILEAAIELPGPVRAGAVLPARLVRATIPGRRGIAELEGGVEASVEPLPRMAEGTRFRAEVVRAAIPEQGRLKPAKVRVTDAPLAPAPSLAERLAGAREIGSYEADLFERHGWSDLLSEAASGTVAFDGGALRISLTPAMTLIDVDGHLAPDALAIAGAAATARAIRRLDISGNIGIDLPTAGDKAARSQAAARVDATLPQPFERTAVNGFGFLQIVRRRTRPSIPEIVTGDPAGASARALLRLAERTPGHGPLDLYAHPAVARRIEGEGWLEVLIGRIGAAAALRPDPVLPISGGHVQRVFL